MKQSKKRIVAVILAVVMIVAMMATGASAATHIVEKGDTLWGIAKEYLGSGFKWEEIYEANKDLIKDPNLIYVGQEFVIPGEEEPEAPVVLDPIEVNVTIADKGELVVTKQTVTVTDADGDGAYTVNDVLYAAHDAAYEGGVAAGYATADTQWGLSITRLWGDESGNFGYWLNNASCWSLTDSVAEGDYVVAFVYYDGTNFSDAYSYFTEESYTAVVGEALTVELKAVSGYDENWNRLFDVYAGATLTAEGATVVDNGDGTYAVTFASAGTYYLVATAENNAIVPAVVEITVEPAIQVDVTLADKGELVMTKQTVTVTDADGDGAYTVNDVLYAAHDAAYEGGVAAGYATADTQWGLSIAKLWGDESGNFGYWLNNASCWSLTDPVAEGDYVVAFVYYDGTNYSDAYAYFTEGSYTVAAGEALSVELQAVSGYDENWNRLFSAYAGATLSVVGGEGAVVDNGDGTYSVTVADACTYYLVATTENNAIVPAVAELVVE